jgi:hypothetical protein
LDYYKLNGVDDVQQDKRKLKQIGLERLQMHYPKYNVLIDWSENLFKHDCIEFERSNLHRLYRIIRIEC